MGEIVKRIQELDALCLEKLKISGIGIGERSALETLRIALTIATSALVR